MKKVVVALSGGVDSSVAAALLKRKGYQVSGIHLRLWFDQEHQSVFKKSANFARRAAARLKIPFKVIDCRQQFKKEVVNYFLYELKAGRTPNPCIVCNQLIKFGFLLKKAKSLGADYLATGHYVRLNRNGNKISLGRGRDSTKDQSYFLYTLMPHQLKHLLFPLGDLTKTQVRQIARRLKLPTADRAESNDICFIRQGSYSEFLKKYLRLKPGLIISTRGKKLGQHQGLPLYTLGQRSGLGIGGRGPFYVVKKDTRNNRLIVGQEDNSKLQSSSFRIKKVNFISGQIPKLPLRCLVQVRYRQKAVPAIIKIYRKKLTIFLKQAERAITPGQSAVFYQAKRLIGGGIIDFTI